MFMPLMNEWVNEWCFVTCDKSEIFFVLPTQGTQRFATYRAPTLWRSWGHIFKRVIALRFWHGNWNGRISQSPGCLLQVHLVLPWSFTQQHWGLDTDTMHSYLVYTIVQYFVCWKFEVRTGNTDVLRWSGSISRETDWVSTKGWWFFFQIRNRKVELYQHLCKCRAMLEQIFNFTSIRRWLTEIWSGSGGGPMAP